MSNENSLSSSFEALFGKMESFLTTKTVVSEPITVGDVVIVPLVEVSFGVGAGAYDKGDPGKDGGKKDAGGGGLGARITPSAVIVISNGNAKLINITSQFGLSKLLDIAPDVLTKIMSLTGGKNKTEKGEKADSSGQGGNEPDDK